MILGIRSRKKIIKAIIIVMMMITEMKKLIQRSIKLCQQLSTRVNSTLWGVRTFKTKAVA